MSLTNPLKKMSKSDNDEKGCIYLSDTPEQIRDKVKGAVSTPEGIANLLEIVKALDGEFEYTGKNQPLKEYVADLIINELK